MLLPSVFVSGATCDVTTIITPHREKKLLVGSDDYGRDLTGVQNLRKKHKRLEGELGSHEAAIQAVQETGTRLANESHLMQDEIAARVSGLAQNWKELNDMAANRCAQ